MKKTVLFGNGLGMALDPLHFNLTIAMRKGWNASHLSTTNKELINACLPRDHRDGPSNEEELELLQEVTAACKLLKSIETEKFHWLSRHGASFPASIDAYTQIVARTICDFILPSGETSEAWGEFSKSFTRFLADQHPHVLTLNYDDLVYDLLKGAELFETVYKDGFHNGRFSVDYLRRSPKEKFCSFFLKIHGSPYFYTAKDNTIRRAPRGCSKLILDGDVHLVLSHLSKKETLIESSPILETYWEFLQIALRESEEILLFGYSGNDTHLNQLITKFPNLKLRVVEWISTGKRKVREDFWSQELKRKVDYIPLESILSFTEW